MDDIRKQMKKEVLQELIQHLQGMDAERLGAKPASDEQSEMSDDSMNDESNFSDDLQHPIDENPGDLEQDQPSMDQESSAEPSKMNDEEKQRKLDELFSRKS